MKKLKNIEQRIKLRNQFKEEFSREWEDAQGEFKFNNHSMDYVTWLESKLINGRSGVEHEFNNSVISMTLTMRSFFKQIEQEIEGKPGNLKLLGARWAYKIAMEQFNNRFKNK